MEFFVDQIRLFLDQANYDNEQLANITQLMGTICRSELESDYPVSMQIDLNRYQNSTGKAIRCRGIDRVMDSMFGVFKRAALNKSEPLDFSSIQYPSEIENSPKDAYYNLTDLINVMWISAEAPLDLTCNITGAINEYVRLRTSNSTAQDRSQLVTPHGYLGSLLEFIDRLLDPILGLQKRFYWEGSNRVEVVYIGIGNQLGYLRDGLGKGFKSTRERVSNMFNYSLNSTHLNSTSGGFVSNFSSTSLEPTTLAPFVPLGANSTTANVTNIIPEPPQPLNVSLPITTTA